MKVILYMAITTNGFIAKENDDTGFVSENSWKEYQKFVSESNCIIVGRRTYEIIPREEFTKNKVYIVFTEKADLEEKTDNIRFTNENPKLVLKSLEKEGFDRVLVAGGGTLNASFMTGNLIDEIYLDIEPIILGQGTPLFRDKDFERNLKLLGQKKINDNEIQLHYEIFK